MIPRGRPALTEADIAAEKEVNLKTWQRNEGESLRAQVPLVNEGGRLRLYDEEQVRAYLSGSTWPPGQRDQDVAAGSDDAGTTWPPAVPPGEEHPGDLLTDQEAAAVLETKASTVRDYGKSGYLPVVQRHGRTWYRRADLEARLEAGDQRHHPELTGAGRPQGAKDRAPRRRPDVRVTEIAAALALAARAETPEPTPGEIGKTYGVGERTAQRLLLAAREQEAGEA
ncbi:helix-turn-helix domain-containing protein [Streptomyces sp. ZAF1911]|uniref:helix-turn-helix domain-containing protein n=1 Tax=Streptomyces sp. ZAF1911 TaxID=2944129 RepID=UPI00237B0C81|nr:helix-turn-helix domain-containing protein [Streptomyces sp. ZAF1911]MDD9383150.1 helix-turn-helix domain-containing protein [Streptomyces sp. ZAF1911]